MLKSIQKRNLSKRKNANFFTLKIEIFILVLEVLETLVYGNSFVFEAAKAQVTIKRARFDRFLVLVQPFNLASKGSDLDYIAKASTDHVNSTLSKYKRILVLLEIKIFRMILSISKISMAYQINPKGDGCGGRVVDRIQNYTATGGRPPIVSAVCKRAHKLDARSEALQSREDMVKGSTDNIIPFSRHSVR